MNYNQSSHQGNYNFEYNFGYDGFTATKELEVEIEPAMANYSGNYSSSSSGSPSSNSIGAFERSISSLSLGHPSRPPPPPEAANIYPHHLDAPFRRVYSAGDLDSGNSYMARRMRRSGEQRAPESPLSMTTSNEDSLIIQGCLLTATKYSPEQKKERVERYKNKRNQRNFQKKIQYTCRKTLADSRPRVKGRFVRNDATELPTPAMDTWYEDPAAVYDSLLLNDECSSNNQHQHQEQEDGYDYVGEESSWVNLVDCSFPIFPTSHYI